jgi:UDP-N-acetylglucosamine 1-carboxyvinyltransferase
MSSEKFIIHGGKSLKGELYVQGSKNASLAILASTLITDKRCTLKNIPQIEDVNRMVEILKSVGAEISWTHNNELTVISKKLNPENLDFDKVSQIRASIMIIGALATRFEKVTIPTPGGCQIGSRPLTAHLEGFKEMGFQITDKKDSLVIERVSTPQKEIVLTEFSPTATVNMLLIASTAKNLLTIYSAAQDYAVQDVCWFLESLGISIQGIGTHTLSITGGQIVGEPDYHIMPDPIEVGTFICLAAATRSTITIKKVAPEFIRLELKKLKEIGVSFSITNTALSTNKKYNLADILVKPSTQLKALDKIHNMPAPGLMPDILPPLAVLLTQSNGTTLIHDWMYEGRLRYLKELIKMGANATILDPHRAIIIGPTPLYGKHITSYDLRAGATLIIAALLAEGKTQIDNIYQVDRGYQEIDKRLTHIGASIERS